MRVIFVNFLILSGCSMSESQKEWAELSYYSDNTFKNLEPMPKRGPFDVLKWLFSGEKQNWPDWVEVQTDHPPVFYDKKKVGHSVDAIRLSFINHSSFLIQIAGQNILTDPVYSKRTSPVSWAGPKRVHAPGIPFEELPPIHLVVISHDHYDHLDFETLSRLKFAENAIILTGLGVGRRLSDLNLKAKILELKWWQSVDLKLGQATFVPAKHFSGRGLFDRNSTLWGGFVLEIAKRKIYFAGDTGYDQSFSTFPKKFPHLDLALIPIGAYLPRWFMSPVHVDPSEAIKIHQDVKADYSIGMHFGTFQLTDEAREDPNKRLKKLLTENDIKNFATLAPGEFLEL